ncbi:MAG: peptidase [Sphingobacteriales bacterium]|nr:peptidase [Sphingobacteriales bacterium]
MKLLKIIYISIITLSPLFSYSQDKEKPKENWQNLDLQSDGMFGISTEKAYNELLIGKESKSVIVAVIDGGVDKEHEDLKDVMWLNSKEIIGNKKDDDNNGYSDDIFGWNYLGSSKGNVRYDNLEMIRLIRKYQEKYAATLNSTPLSPTERKEFKLYKKLVTEYMDERQEASLGLDYFSKISRALDSIEKRISKATITLKDIDDYKAKTEEEEKVIKVIKKASKKESSYAKIKEELNDALSYYDKQLKYHLNLDFDPRDSIGDNYTNINEITYGNNDVTGPDALHGSHVSGIIGANRKNSIGIKGVADHVKIMALRAVPDGDERDKDVANSIRYAVNNGAKVINMSFGKGYSWNKAIVDSAVKYAVSKDVLLIHAAGNDGKNNDLSNNFPSKFFGDTINENFKNLDKPLFKPLETNQNNTGVFNPRKKPADKKPKDSTTVAVEGVKAEANSWIEVGASNWKDNDDLVASFSNYGKKSVDVFAPGVEINSTIPGSKYKEEEGTSMASPVVAGLAALIRSYFPNLTAVQVKDIILNSVSKVNHKVKIKDETGGSRKVNFQEICVSGGIVNAYNAILLAQKATTLTNAK